MTSQGSIEAPNQLLLNCHIQGDHYEDIIEISIDATLQVTRLKEMIEEKSKNRFQIADMIIWRVSIPRDEHLRETLYRFKFTESSNVKPLWPSHSLAEYFQAVPPEENHLHIRVQKISYYSIQDIKHCLFDDDIQETNNRLREELKDNWPPLPPSILAAKPNSEFLLNPNNKASRFLCGRPSKAEFGIPIVLLHPVFAQFMDDCEEYTPTAEDYSFVKELSTRMCEHYAEKWDRRTAFQDVLPKYRIYLYAALIQGTQYLADHHVILNPHMYLSTACNDEMGDGGSDPYLKSGINHALSIIHMEEMKANMGPMPCFHIYYSGPCVGFAGSFMSEKFVMNPLGPIIPLFRQSSNSRTTTLAARMFGAFRKAVKRLVEHYETLNHPLAPKPDPRFPYVTQYTPLPTETNPNPTPIKFRYLDRHPGSSLLFRCREKESGKMLAVKFVNSYSKEAHLICAERNGAPILYGFEKLAGGWYVVVMEHLDPRQYRPPTYADRSFMHSTAKEHITALHERGYVHGDIRTVNLFVGPEDRVMLLDFDWAGKIGEARYPENVNPSVDGFNTRPDGAEDGQLITVAHDLRMVDLLKSEHGLWFFSE